MKQIQGSLRVKINEYVHAWSEFLFVSLRILFAFTSLQGLQDVENHCAHLRDIEMKTGRKNSISPPSHVLFSIKLNWRARNYETKKYIFPSNPEKEHKNKHKKT